MNVNDGNTELNSRLHMNTDTDGDLSEGGRYIEY